MREAFHSLSMPVPLCQPEPNPLPFPLSLHSLPGFLWLHLCSLDGLQPVPEPDSVLFLSLWLHQRAHNFKLALDATSEGHATGGGVQHFILMDWQKSLQLLLQAGLIGKASAAAAAQQLRRFQLSRPLCVCLIIHAFSSCQPPSLLPALFISILYYYFLISFIANVGTHCYCCSSSSWLPFYYVFSLIVSRFSFRLPPFVIYLLIYHSNNNNKNEGIRYNSIIFIVLNSHFRSQCGFAGESNIVSIVCYFWQEAEPCWPTIIATISQSKDTIYTI